MDVPPDAPVTTPEVPTVAADVLLVHVPPPGVLVSAVVAPAHTVAVPLSAEGAELTVITSVL
jgi:hypothetical protein